MDFPVPNYASKYEPSYWENVGEWFRKVGGAHLRTLETLPDALDLADWLMEEARRREPRGMYPGTGQMRAKGMGRDDIIVRAEETAQWLLDTHKPYKPRFTTEQSRKGGKSSRRPKALLMAYRALRTELDRTGEVVTFSEIAKRLGTTDSSLRRVRRQMTTMYFDLTPSPESLDELISEIEDVEIPDEAQTMATVTEIFNGVFAQYGLTRAQIFTETPDWSQPYAWADEYQGVAA